MSALTGIRIVDLADESGAYCGKLLGDMGADVIKVEPPRGDPTREIGPFFAGKADRNHSLFFWHYNTNKRSVTLDFENDDDRQRLNALLGGADAVIVSGSPSSLERRRLDYAALSSGHPGLVVCAISGFGQSGPRAGWKSCDNVTQAPGGM